MIRASHSVELPAFAGRKCHYILTDSLSELGDFAQSSNLPNHRGSHSWDFNTSTHEAISLCTTGNTSAVAESDALLEKMEAHTDMPSTRSTWVDDVTGAFPNVPAFISGQPLNMRYRTRTQSESAPLAIIIDLTISAGIPSTQVRARGVAILALTRALSAHRPIELWAGGFLDSQGRNASFAAARISTTPLDLSSACYALAHPAFIRQVIYNLLTHHHNARGAWPFSMSRTMTRSEMESILAPLFTHTSSILCLPGLHLTDESVTNPLSWLKRELAEHDPLRLEDAEA